MLCFTRLQSVFPIINRNRWTCFAWFQIHLKFMGLKLKTELKSYKVCVLLGAGLLPVRVYSFNFYPRIKYISVCRTWSFLFLYILFPIPFFTSVPLTWIYGYYKVASIGVCSFMSARLLLCLFILFFTVSVFTMCAFWPIPPCIQVSKQRMKSTLCEDYILDSIRIEYGIKILTTHAL